MCGTATGVDPCVTWVVRCFSTLPLVLTGFRVSRCVRFLGSLDGSSAGCGAGNILFKVSRVEARASPGASRYTHSPAQTVVMYRRDALPWTNVATLNCESEHNVEKK
ncbi:hypothetical protein E2C01_096832 [Portunus trituberculatus]|uniref:Uncharacterized protein n=1 Tax=Portunus trituberculatus TaxID=210409 RepID=A0A5B7JTJ5_PORTR|nr:hypothetical protein [Portunus trituberculatus]